jgi:hypothetical protein
MLAIAYSISLEQSFPAWFCFIGTRSKRQYCRELSGRAVYSEMIATWRLGTPAESSLIGAAIYPSPL